jgi:carbamoyltransferase
MIILGLNAFHADSSAALVQDGKLIAAAEEERFRRIKHWAGFPSHAIAYCLNEAGVQISDVEHVAFNQNNRANLIRKIGYFLTKRPNINFVLSRVRNRRAREGLQVLLEQALPGQTVRAEFHGVEHHLAHLSSAFHVCPFDQAAVASIDGFGDFSSAAWGAANSCEISTYGRVYFPHSLGIFYQALTQYLGFPHYGDEYKVMGLAPYGRPMFLDAMRKIVHVLPSGGFELDLKFFRHHRKTCPINGRTDLPSSAICFRRGSRSCWGRDAKRPIPLRIGIATSPDRSRHYMRRHSFIFSTCCRSVAD